MHSNACKEDVSTGARNVTKQLLTYARCYENFIVFYILVCYAVYMTDVAILHSGDHDCVLVVILPLHSLVVILPLHSDCVPDLAHNHCAEKHEQGDSECYIEPQDAVQVQVLVSGGLRRGLGCHTMFKQSLHFCKETQYTFARLHVHHASKAQQRVQNVQKP